MYNQAKSVLGKNRTPLILIKERYILMLFLPLKHSQNAVFYRGNRHFCKKKTLKLNTDGSYFKVYSISSDLLVVVFYFVFRSVMSDKSVTIRPRSSLRRIVIILPITQKLQIIVNEFLSLLNMSFYII